MQDAQLAPSEKSLTKERGWEDGDRGGPAQTKKTSDKKKKNRLDTNRPSHGRTWEIQAEKERKLEAARQQRKNRRQRPE
jgi:hypothetical protein